MIRRRLTTLLALGFVAGCSLVVAPEKPSITAAIVLDIPETLDPVLSQVNRLHIQVTAPRGVVRDTVLLPTFNEEGIRARAILRPTEDLPGTRLNIVLKEYGTPLFEGSVVIGEGSGWPFEIRVAVAPVAVFAAGEDRVVTVGETVDLGQAATIRFEDDGVSVPESVVWLSSDSSIVRMTGGIANAVAPGQTTVLGIWYGQVDTVAFDVTAAAGTPPSPPGVTGRRP